MRENVAFCIACLCVLFAGSPLYAAKPRLLVSGLIDTSGALIQESFTPNKTNAANLNLRLNTNLIISDRWRAYASLNGKSYVGSILEDYTGYSFLQFNRFDWINLNKTWKDDAGALIYSRIDQAYLDYASNGFSIRVGRQLISWGHTLVWNVNDIFNTHSLLDITRPVKQGSDAIKLSIFPAPVAVIEVAAKLNQYHKLTAAAMTRINFSGIDWQLQTGLVDSRHWTIGGGVTGKIGRVILRSEGAVFLSLLSDKPSIPDPLFPDEPPVVMKPSDKGTLLFALGADYVSEKQLVIQAEMLYNEMNIHWNAGLFSRIYRSISSPLSLSPSRWSFALNTSYLLTPRIKAALTTTMFADDHFVIVLPSLNWQFCANSQVFASYQYASLHYDKKRQTITGLLLRLSHNF